jgi:hypothetical protein
MTLFRGRGDAHGTWEGGCKREIVTIEKFRNHLAGHELIGIYPVVPMRGEPRCVWGCSDIDVDDMDSAFNLATAFAVKGIKAWVEKTRKGYHVWVFSTRTVLAATMRRAFLAAHQAINYPAKEVNPKQEQIGNGLGNYVRLPYPNAFGELTADHHYNDVHVRYMIDEEGHKLSLGMFVSNAIQRRAEPEELEILASFYKPPAISTFEYQEQQVTDDIMSLVHRAGGMAYVIWRDGPKNGSDRSLSLWKIAMQCRDNDLTPSEAVEVVRSADLRWGKYWMRKDPDMEIHRMIAKAYGS